MIGLSCIIYVMIHLRAEARAERPGERQGVGVLVAGAPVRGTLQVGFAHMSQQQATLSQMSKLVSLRKAGAAGARG